MPVRFRIAAALLALATLSSCFDMPEEEKEEQDEKSMSEAEQALKFRQAVDAKGKAKPKVQLREFGTEAPKKQEPPKEEPVAVQLQVAHTVDAGAEAEVAARPELVDAGAEVAEVAAGNPLLAAWKNAKAGDFVNVRCMADVQMFQNQVVRNVTLKLAVKSATADQLTLVVDAQGTEDRPNRKVKKDQKPPKTLDIKGSYELVISREPKGTKEPALPLELGTATEQELKVGSATVKASCTKDDQSASDGPLRERCVSADPASVYLTNGALKLTEQWKSRASSGKKVCEVTAFGNGAPPPAAKRTAATEWTYADRGDGHFREQVASASAGLVEIQFDRLAVAKKSDKQTVTFADKKYVVGLRDRRTVPLLDWALQRTIPDFPSQLADE